MTIWDALEELITNTRLPRRVQEKIIDTGRVLFRETFELNDRLKLLTVVTAASQCGYGACEDACLAFAEMRGLDRGFVKALIDPMMDLSRLSPGEMAAVQLVRELGQQAAPSALTLSAVRDHFTAEEVEYIIFLASFIHFIARLDIIGR